MDELIKQVSARTGLSEDKARVAVNTVLDFLKDKLPSTIGGQIDNVVAGGAGIAGDLADRAGEMLGGLGGALGKK